VNNRNLKTLVTDLAVTEHLAALLPEDRVLICESGLKTPADLARMAKAGARRFLIGESLMKQTDVEAATRAILTPERAHV
jgi:indole-3-glycerol phosphate synthase